ncbi:MAG: FHA domain-containing protein [Phocaeicola sp.]|uniref:FHA domain-containing protein n=1 Tax=Phocaeicola sp. TaxID=2773926 RepID=UPI003F9F6102
MKRVRCPKCDNYIMFDETKYIEGQSLIFVCDNCHKEFKIRIGKSPVKPLQRDDHPDEEANKNDFGSIVVLKNDFAFKQVLPLKEGDNMIGKRVRTIKLDVPIESNDPSLDRQHCIINVKVNKTGKVVYTLRDNDSLTGTFLMNEEVLEKECRIIDDGAIINLGATTIILRAAENKKVLS